MKGFGGAVSSGAMVLEDALKAVALGFDFGAIMACNGQNAEL